VPAGTSAAQISAMVSSAVKAATANSATRGDLETLVAASIADAAKGQLSAADVEKIVAASLVATNSAIDTANAAAAAAAAAAAEQAKGQLSAQDVKMIVGSQLIETNKAIDAATAASKKAQEMAAAAALPATECYVIGNKVTNCPPVSARTYAAPLTPKGKFPSYAYAGPRPTTFQESPMSHQLVKQGKIPPVAQRLPVPEDVMVLDVQNEIGQYGGTWRITQTGSVIGDLDDKADCMYREPNEIDSIPEVCKDFQVSQDGKTWTMTLRRGAKWSDGKPHTMDDVKFAWEDLNLNTNLNPTIGATYRDAVTDNPVKFTSIDDVTYTLSFDTPSFTLTDGKSQRGYWNCGRGGFCWHAPKHFLTAYHPDYASADSLNAAMGKYQQSDWTRLMRKVTNPRDMDIGIKGPSMNAWYHESILDTEGHDVRNHFFIGTDPEGNQLPYIDKRISAKAESRAVAVLRTMAGETDQNSCLSSIPELPLYLSNMEKGDYSLYHWPTPGGNDMAISLNQTWNTDPEMGKLIRTKEFRFALGHAINKVALNNNVFLGLGVPQNWAPHPATPYYPGLDIAQANTEFDPVKAGQMLDALGLVDTDDDGIRNRADGKNLVLFAQHGTDEAVQVSEMIQQNWADVGIGVTYNADGGWYKKIRDNSEYLAINPDYSCYQHNPWNVSWTRLAPLNTSSHFANDIGRYYTSAGAEGQAPGIDLSFQPTAPEANFPSDVSGNIQRTHDLWQDGRNFGRYDPKRVEIGKEIFELQSLENYAIGTVAYTGVKRGIAVVRNNFRNVPQSHTRDCWGFWRETYYFEGGQDNYAHPGNKSNLYESTSFYTAN